MSNPNRYPIPQVSLPRPGTVKGDARRRQFISDLGDICGNGVALWLPLSTNTTTTTSAWRDARVWTYDATVAARTSVLGSLTVVDFNGTAHEADTPDTADMSFGNATVDAPFSVGVLCEPDVNNAVMTLLAKENSATAEEWGLELDASGYLVTRLTDESASATLLGTYQTAVGTAWTLLGFTYDGRATNAGITNWKDGASVTTLAGGTGTYVAMENTAALVHLGARYATKAQFFDGGKALAFGVAGELHARQWWDIKEAVNAVTGLTL